MKEFFDNIRLEWNEKLTWPTGKEMKLHTSQVFIFMVILGLFFAVVDGIISMGIATATGTEDAYEAAYDYDEYELDELLDEEQVDDNEDGDEG